MRSHFPFEFPSPFWREVGGETGGQGWVGIKMSKSTKSAHSYAPLKFPSPFVEGLGVRLGLRLGFLMF